MDKGILLYDPLTQPLTVYNFNSKTLYAYQ